MRCSSLLLLAATLLASACDSKAPASKTADKAPDKAPDAKLEPMPAGATPGEAEASTPEAQPTPAWFDAEKIPHAAITKQMASKGAVGGGGPATAMILELEAGVTPQQCIERATTVIAAEVGEVPAATEADGRLTIQGKTDTYSYTVVCGDANGKPSMYLAFNA